MIDFSTMVIDVIAKGTIIPESTRTTTIVEPEPVPAETEEEIEFFP